MQNSDYYKNLISLYEAVGMTGTEEVVPQEQIADTGSDVMPNNQYEAQPQDAQNYQNQPVLPEPTQATDETSELVLEKEKFKKIFNLFKDLLDYIDVFLENIKFMNVNLLDVSEYQQMTAYVKTIEKLQEKINSYLINVFNSDPYKKVLYAYVLFRTELITCVKGLRDVLDVMNPDTKKSE